MQTVTNVEIFRQSSCNEKKHLQVMLSILIALLKILTHTVVSLE